MKVSFGKPFINNLDIKKISKVLENPILAHGNNIINFDKLQIKNNVKTLYEALYQYYDEINHK